MIGKMTARLSLANVSPAACGLAPPSHELRFAAGRRPGSVSIADFNGDDKLDMVVANERSGDASVLLGDGKGGFSPAPGSPFPAGQSPNDIAAGDFNHDGHPDLAFANHETQHLTVLLGDGRGGFAPAPGSPVTVAVQAASAWHRDRRLQRRRQPATCATHSWAEDRLEILFGDGKGAFPTPGIYVAVGKHPYQRIRVADLNGDGRADIVSPNLEGDDVTILLGDGAGGFRQPEGSPFAGGDSPFNVAVGDVNADRKPDLAIVNSPSSTFGSIRSRRTDDYADRRRPWWVHHPGGLTVRHRQVPRSSRRSASTSDGVADVAVSSPEGGYVTLFTMSRKGSVAQPGYSRFQVTPKVSPSRT